jgi:hypothetical protein
MGEDFRYHPQNTWTVLDVDDEYVNEQNLFDSTIVEANDIFGLPIEYYVLNFDIEKTDKIYGEDSNDQYTGPYSTKIWHRPHDETHLVDMFGIINSEVLESLNIPKFTWERDVSDDFIPKAGDVMKFLYNGIYYEVTHAHEEESIFLTKKLSYNISAKLYRTTNADAEPGGTPPNVELDQDTEAFPLSAFGDNVEIEIEANEIDDLSDLPNFLDLYAVGDKD